MQLHFLTRDWKNDYPRIGWLPRLPEGVAQLWEQFHAPGWQQPEYPQLILEQHGGVWQLFVSGQDSGRTDSPDGRGRRIRLTFYVSGNVSEAQVAPLGWLEAFLRETLNSSESNRVRDILREGIPPEAPTAWAQQSAAEQKSVADGLCKALCALPAEKTQGDAPARWYAGAQSENLPKFLGFCEELFAGKRNGMAFSLTYLGRGEVEKANQLCAQQENLAILLSNGEERQLPLAELSKPLARNMPRARSRPVAMGTRPDGHAKPKGGFSFWGPLAVVMAILLFCALRCHAGHGGHNSQNSSSFTQEKIEKEAYHAD